MKKNILLILSLITISATSQQCFDYTQYTDTQLQGMINNTTAGSVIVQQGDIALVRLDSSLQISGITSTQLFYYGFPGLGFDVSSFSSPCKKVTITGTLFELTVDGDSIQNPTGGAEFAFNGGTYTVHRDTSYNYTIEGDFDLFNFNSTNVIETLCIESCTPASNCFDFTQYSTTQLGDLATTTPVGSTIVQQGDISLIRVDSSIIGIDVIDTISNGLSYFGFSGLGFDVSSFSSTCKKVTFSGLLFTLFVDNDTITNTTATYTHNGGDYIVTRDSSNYIIEGDFDIFHFYSTNIINNICIESCDSTTSLVNSEMLSFSVYPNPTTNVLNINIFNLDIDSYIIIAFDGSIVKTSNNTTNIDVSDLTVGAYKLLLLDNEGVIGSTTFIKK